MTHDLNDTLIFVKVVEQGSFIAAANSLGLPKTTVSRKVQELETRLGAQLLHRTTRRVSPTLDGAAYYERCVSWLAELDDIEGVFSQRRRQPRGRLRVDLPGSLGRALVIPALIMDRDQRGLNDRLIGTVLVRIR